MATRRIQGNGTIRSFANVPLQMRVALRGLVRTSGGAIRGGINVPTAVELGVGATSEPISFDQFVEMAPGESMETWIQADRISPLPQDAVERSASIFTVETGTVTVSTDEVAIFRTGSSSSWLTTLALELIQDGRVVSSSPGPGTGVMSQGFKSCVGFGEIVVPAFDLAAGATVRIRAIGADGRGAVWSRSINGPGTWPAAATVTGWKIGDCGRPATVTVAWE